MRRNPVQQFFVNTIADTREYTREKWAHDFIQLNLKRSWYQRKVLQCIHRWLKKHKIPYMERYTRTYEVTINVQEVQELIMHVADDYMRRSGQAPDYCIIGSEQMNKLRIELHTTMQFDLEARWGNRHGLFYRNLRLIVVPSITSGIICLGKEQLE